jgi:putative transposase
MTTREIEGHIKEMYGVEVSPTLISSVTEAVMEEVKAWQNRPLEETYPILYLDALRVKIRDGGHVVNKAIYVAIAVNMEGNKEVLGLWAEDNEGAKFWLQVLTDLQNRGAKDFFIACVDGLKGFPEAIEAVYPRTEVQLCIVHLGRRAKKLGRLVGTISLSSQVFTARASLNYVNWKQRQEVAGDLRLIYKASTVTEAETKRDEFARKWDATYPMVSQIWRRNWERIVPFFAYPGEIRKVIYTTNTIESLNMSLRKIIKMRGSFPNEDAAMKLLYLALRNASKKWTMPVQNWSGALNRFSILWPERMPALDRV